MFFSDNFLIPTATMARRFNNPIKNVVFSNFKPLDGILDQERTGIYWISLADKDLKSMIEVIIDSVRDTTVPKHIVVMSLQKYVGGTNVNTMKAYVKEIVDEVNAQKYNKLVFSTANFIPNHERIWQVTAKFNKMIHAANEKMNMARVNGHKAVMIPVSKKDKRRRVRVSQWFEPQLGIGLGNTLSYEGQKNLVKYIMTVLDTTFSSRGQRLESQEAKDLSPPSLAHTTGYNDDLYMKQQMAAKHIIYRPIPEGERQLLCSNKKHHGYLNYWIHKEHGMLRRFNEREGVLFGIQTLMKRGDSVPMWTEMARENEVRADEEIEVITIDDEYLINEEEEAVREIHMVEEVSLEELEIDDMHSVSDEQDMNVDNNVHVEPEKQKKRNDNESDDYKIQGQLDEKERQVQIAEEKTQSYKSMMEAQEAKISKERAASKYWQKTAENKEVEKKKILEQLRELQFEYDHIKGNLKRMTAEYEFLRNTYSSEKRKQERLRVTRRYTEDEDFELYGKNQK